MLEVIAHERLKSRSSSIAVTDWIDSELVRITLPSRSERRGRAPLCLQLASRWLLPRAPAATTTPRALTVLRRLRSQAPERSLVTAYPSEPSAAPSGQISVTIRSGRIVTPSF